MLQSPHCLRNDLECVEWDVKPLVLLPLLCTFTAGGNDKLEHMSVVGALQGVQEATIHIIRLVHDDVQQ